MDTYFKKYHEKLLKQLSVDDTSQKVFIIRVLRHERNWQKILRYSINEYRRIFFCFIFSIF